MANITIPPAAIEAGAMAIAESLRTARLTLESDDGYKPEARAACLAMLENWPGIEPAMQMSNDDWTTLRGVRLDGIILPLTEASDDQ